MDIVLVKKGPRRTTLRQGPAGKRGDSWQKARSGPGAEIKIEKVGIKKKKSDSHGKVPEGFLWEGGGVYQKKKNLEREGREREGKKTLLNERIDQKAVGNSTRE